MKEKIKNLLKNGRGSLIAIFILELLVMFFVTPNRYDDKVFLENVTGTTIISYIGPRYFNWTSRFLIEFVLCAVLKTSKYLWILIQALMVTLIGYSIFKIFIKDNKNENSVMLLFMILMYPLNIMTSAGWAATTVNYMWPLATCLFALIPIRKIWDGEKIKIGEYLLYSLALIFAGNQEQTCAILFGSYILFAILMIMKNKKIHPYMIVQNILIIASLIFILTCPGNYVRNQEEIDTYFKDFEMLTVLDKISLGLTSTMGLIIKSGTLTYTLLALLIAVYIFSNYKEKLYRIVAVIPLISICVFSHFVKTIYTIFPMFDSFHNYIIKEELMLTAANCNNLLNIFPIIFAYVNFVCLILSILLIFRKLKDNIAIIVFMAGFASRMLMGFSPTVFISGQRTMIYLEFAMIIVSILIWQELIKKSDKTDKKIQKRTEVLIKSLGVFQYINILLFVLMTQK